MDPISLKEKLNLMSREEMQTLIIEYNDLLIKKKIHFESKSKNDSKKTTIIEKTLHSLEPKEKKAFLSRYDRMIISNGKKMTIDYFASTLPFVGIINTTTSKNDRKKKSEISFFSQTKAIQLPNEVYKKIWENDPWFIHLSKLQINASLQDTFENEPIFSTLHTSSITYCMLLRYKDETQPFSSYNYQIYIGKQKTATRWNRSGNNHLAQIRKILHNDKAEYSACDLSIAYFGPLNCIVFAIDHSSKEGFLSKNFPHYNESSSLIDMTKNKISLSPKKGDDIVNK